VPTPQLKCVPVSDIPPAIRHQLIQQAAHRRAEDRGFAPGFDLDDWLAAEAEVDAILSERYR
jgi:hypothetical protein